jgi:hypothetical protein
VLKTLEEKLFFSIGGKKSAGSDWHRLIR